MDIEEIARALRKRFGARKEEIVSCNIGLIGEDFLATIPEPESSWPIYVEGGRNRGFRFSTYLVVWKDGKHRWLWVALEEDEQLPIAVYFTETETNDMDCIVEIKVSGEIVMGYDDILDEYFDTNEEHRELVVTVHTCLPDFSVADVSQKVMKIFEKEGEDGFRDHYGWDRHHED